MRWFCSLSISAMFIFWPVQLIAKTSPLTLSAGEHGSYSRVAIPAGGDLGWTSVQDGRTVKIVLPGLTGPVNTKAIFPRRAAHRVLNVDVTQTARATTLTFKLGCQCSTRIYRWKDTKILMDIQEGSPASSSREKPVHGKQSKSSGLPKNIAPLDIEKTRAALMERLLVAAEAGVVQMEGSEVQNSALPSPQDAEPLSESPSDAMESNQAEGEKPPAHGMQKPNMMPADQASNPGHSSPPPPIVAERTPPEMDRKSEPQLATNIMYGHDVNLQTRKYCLPDVALKLGSWRSRDSFSKELARKRAPLLGEFDTPNEAAAAALAKFYLAHGLGEEASLILGQFVSEEHTDFTLISDLANIFRLKKIEPTGPILGAGECEGAHGLWQAAALALDAHWQDAAKAEKRSGDALAQLPRNIRIPLGVYIAEAALNAGQMEQVRRILALLRRSGTIKSPALDLIEGKFALAENRQDRAHSLLDPLSRSTHPQSVDAILALSKAELITPGFLSEARLVDLSLIAMERRYTQLGRDALILTAWAETAAGRPEAALDILSREADSSSLASEKTQLRKEIAKTLFGLYKPGSGETSLQDTDLFWRYESYLADGENTHAIRRGAARHLLTKGLPNAALTLLRRPGTEVGPPLMLAEALIATGRPDQALKALEAFSTDPHVITMRSTALAQLGRFAEAARLIPEDTRNPDLLKLQAELLWSDGQWEQAARVYTRLVSMAPEKDKSEIDRRITAATFMVGDSTLTRETLSLLKTNGNSDMGELLAPTLNPSLPLPERVDQSLATAQTVTRILKELLADG